MAEDDFKKLVRYLDGLAEVLQELVAKSAFHIGQEGASELLSRIYYLKREVDSGR